MTGQSNISLPPDIPYPLYIPKEVYINNFPFDFKTIKTLAMTCTKFSFFRRTDTLRDTYALMNCFVEGNYDKAEEIVEENPDAMFLPVNYCFNLRADIKETAPSLEKDKESAAEAPGADLVQSASWFKYTSPLQYALEINHAHMLAIFENYLADNPNAQEKFENCKKQFPPLDIYRLLDRVAHADYAEAEKLVKANPNLIFQHAIHYSNTQIIDPDQVPPGLDLKSLYGPASPEYISPLKLAFKNYDSYMWTMFLELTDNQEQFSQQIKEQKEYYTVKPLLAAYDNYLAIFEEYRERYNKAPLETKAEIEKIFTAEFNKVGEEQKKMPRHMLLEIFRPTLAGGRVDEENRMIFSPSFVWDEKHDFDIKKNERPPLQFIGYVENKSNPDEPPCFAIMDPAFPLLGKDVSFTRGNTRWGADISPWFKFAEIDRNNFSRLYDTRVKEFEDELLATLEKTDSNSLLSLNMR